MKGDEVIVNMTEFDESHSNEELDRVGILHSSDLTIILKAKFSSTRIRLFSDNPTEEESS